MNRTLELIEKRRSIRLFDSTPLAQHEKEAILHAALRAPTAGAMMLYTIIEVNDPHKKAILAETCDHQAFIASAPYLLLFLADYQRWMDLYEAAGCAARAAELDRQTRTPAEGDLFLALMDALIAAQTAVIAAESLGIGSCYIGDIIENWEQHRELFNLPRYTFPAVLLCFGRPKRAPLGNPVPRFDPKFIVHQDVYRRFSAEELNDMHLPFGQPSFEPKEYPNGAQNVVQANYLRKFIADFSFEMTRSAREMLKNWLEDR
ncbi:MAG: nitroreductase family protein [Anaerolineales bacterium]|nr:nitroreductase family protein [Anaerolineales bacterium]